MNGYFQIKIEGGETGILLYRASQDGTPLGIQEVTNYLNRQKIAYPLKELNAALHTQEDVTYLKLMDIECLPISESALVTLSPDRMEAYMRFYPPSTNGKGYRLEDFYSQLRLGSVTYGIDEACINRLFEKREYCKDYLVAKGKSVAEGKDAEIIYYFETDNRIRPTLREDGSVDFFHLNVVNHCKVGDVLARRIPEQPGEAGCDVCGNVIKPREVKKQSLSVGLNIELSEDKCVARCLVNGHVRLIEKKIFVSDVLEVTNVDNATGDIDYDGNVIITGNVCANFSVRARGDIEISGAVEGAQIEAGGNLILYHGMNGMGKGTLKAAGNVIARYLENCSVTAAGYVEADSVLHSNIRAGEQISVMSNKGFVSGSNLTASRIVRIKTLGNSMGTDSTIIVGVDPETINRMNYLTQQIAAGQKNLKKMLPVIEAGQKKLAGGAKLLPEQVKTLQQLLLSVKTLQEEIKTAQEQLESLKELIETTQNARVEIHGEVYPGNQITISGVTLMIKSSMKYCALQKKDGEIRMLPL